MPHLEVLPEVQKAIWGKLSRMRTTGLVLYGGTAIALRFGHRASIDFGFLTDMQLSHQTIHQELRRLENAYEVVQDEKKPLPWLPSLITSDYHSLADYAWGVSAALL